ncbi:hypothetical protein [Metallococcus carri]|uniref:hypothetical protein n=1 Tax=Metallococcus carri TaxID=1656884 RepID=UPI0038B2865E
MRALITRRLGLSVLVAYLGFRAISTVFILITAAHQVPAGVPGGTGGAAHPAYLDMMRMWDGTWYREIAVNGYPDQIPRNEAGVVQQNAWAFYPLFPLLARLGMDLTGFSFEAVAAVLTLAMGAGAAVLMARLLAPRVGPLVAFGAVCVYAASPPSPTLQLAYTESLGMLLLLAALLALARRDWLVASGLALLIGLTRPIALPLAVVALVAVWQRWRERREDPIRAGDWAGMVWTLVACGVAGFLWPAIAWWVTGERNAYTETMATWRIGNTIKPFDPWITNLSYLVGTGWAVFWVAVMIAALAAMLLGPWAEALGLQLRVWCAVYAAYLGAVLDVWTSVYRYLLFLFPLAVILIGGGWRRQPDEPRRLVGLRTVVLVLLGIGWQLWWCLELLQITPPADYPI